MSPLLPLSLCLFLDTASHTQPALSPVLRAQILLSRAHFSVGQIDGNAGSNFQHALKGFQAAHDIPPTGTLNKPTWNALNRDTAAALITYTITKEDLTGPFEKLPDDMMQQAQLPSMNFESIDDELGERFHSTPALLHKLNPRKQFDQPETEIWVPDVNMPVPSKAASVIVSKSKNIVSAVDASGKVLAQFPCTSGSSHDPLPLGEWKVKDIVNNPPFYYNPDLFWNADDATQSKAKIAPGPRNPVGVVWIGITKEHYGLHGTPAPSLVGHAQSHGCVRMTNWDALELSKMVVVRMPVYFKE